MPPKSRPPNCFLNDFEHFIRDGKAVWKDGTRLYTWDSQHGEVEVFDKRGYHLGVADAESGQLFKPAVKGRRIRV
jgi:hypothetical protein